MTAPADYLLVPREVSATSATIWAGTTDQQVGESPFAIEHRISGTQWPVRTWQQWTARGAAALSYARVELLDLRPATHYPLLLRVNGAIRAVADVTTLPQRLPAITEPPFTVLLGSCFCVGEDSGGGVGRAFARIPGAMQPHLKLLVGDQVYLDSPWSKFIVPHGATQLAAAFLQQYLATWTQGADQQGFNLLLRSGANYFCGDDHDFWNNVPFPSSFAVDTWTGRGRRTWSQLATTLYHAFQTDQTFTAIDIGQFSIRVMDTRVNRTRDRAQFASAADMQRLREWVDNLSAPGMLVLSQPVFATRAGFFGRYSDWQLADFEQYAELCKVLVASRQSIIVCCGDVHFGRIARATLPSGAELIEVISSPLTLVDPFARGSWANAPARFPAEPIPGIASVPVMTQSDWVETGNHFVTIELHRDGGGMRCRMRPWPTSGQVRGMRDATEFVLKKEA
jgi:hypothetical protein